MAATPKFRRSFVLTLAFSLCFALLQFASVLNAGGPKLPAGSSQNAVLATVNGKPVTELDARQLAMFDAKRSQPASAISRAQVDELIDRRLIDNYLTRRKVRANKLELDRQVAMFKRMIEGRGTTVEKLYAQYGLDESAFREMLALGVRWQSFIRRTITDDQVRGYFSRRKDQFDGTEVRARQIFFKLPDNPSQLEVSKAVTELKGVRTLIAHRQVTFEAAAKKYSQAPSALQGGDVGFFAYRGEMPSEVCKVAFAIKVDDLSQPIVSRYGVHLIQVTDRKQGMLSLEDARNQVLGQMSREIWDKLAKQERAKARIEWKIPPDGSAN